jgi:hypothetical protein
MHTATIEPEFVSATSMDNKQVKHLENIEDRVRNSGDAHFSTARWNVSRFMTKMFVVNRVGRTELAL